MPTDLLRTETLAAKPSIVLPLLPLLLFVAPIAEETLFRGWLWQALRRQGMAPVPTAAISAGLWLLLHAPSGMARLPTLLPLAVLLSIARHHGGVRSSLLLHVVNNAIVAAAIGLALLATGNK